MVPAGCRAAGRSAAVRVKELEAELGRVKEAAAKTLRILESRLKVRGRPLAEALLGHAVECGVLLQTIDCHGLLTQKSELLCGVAGTSGAAAWSGKRQGSDTPS